MKRTIVVFLTGMLSMATAIAQEAKAIFTAMPDSICPLLTAVNRADCIDFIESNMKAEVTNVFGKKTVMTHLTPTYIRIESGNDTRWQMKVLPTGDTTRVVCVSSTVRVAPGASASADSLPADSHLRFYTTGWQELPTAAYLPVQPQLQDFFCMVPDSVSRTATYATAEAEAALPLIEAVLQPEGEELHFKLTTLRMLAPETAKVLHPYVRSEIVWKWDNGIFKPSAR